jgi:hypothetical protein
MPFLLVLILLVIAGALSPGRAWAVKLPAAFVCEFSTGVFSTAEGGSFTTSETHETLHLTFASIDQERGTAQLIGNQAAGDVLLFFTQLVVNFVEFTPIGNPTVTTVYTPPDVEGRRFLASHSRHIGGFSGGPMVSQYLGFCEARWP